MSRSCTKHYEYTSQNTMRCEIHPAGESLTACSGCQSFELAALEPRSLPAPERLSPAPRDEPRPTRRPCADLGPARKCCGGLFLCRRHKPASCVVGVSPNSALRSCETCEDWRPVQAWAPVPGVRWQDNAWEGPYVRRPWHYSVTVAIPVLNASEACAAILELLRLQTERPFIVFVDTGSSDSELQALQALRAEDCEVHSLRLNGVQHPSDFPAMAMDLAFSLCRTPYLLATHADVFLTARGVVGELLRLCRDVSPVVGYEITERPHSDWRGMVGHTLTMFDIAAMDRINAGWSLRRLLANFNHPDKREATRDISHATLPNWPDTELLVNYQCRAAGIVPHIIGTERNAARTVDDRIDHCRSWVSARTYTAGSDYAAKVTGWLEDGIIRARERVAAWRAH